MIIGEQEPSPNTRDANLVATITKARYWLQRLNSSEHVTIASLAREVGVEDGEVSRLLPLAFLAREIVEAVFEGRQLSRAHSAGIDAPKATAGAVARAEAGSRV